MILLDGQYPFDDQGLSEISPLRRASSRRDSITGYLISTQSRFVRWRFRCNLLVGKADYETLQEFFAERNGTFDLVDWRGFSWLTASGTDDATHAYSTGALFDQDEITGQPQQANGYLACDQHWIVPVTFIVNARGLVGQSGGPTGEGTMVRDVPGGAIDGSNATFTVSQTYTTFLLFVNGQEQKIGTDYNISGTTITFIAGAIPQTGDSIDGYGVL